jgi:hypothetical protein
VISLKATRSDRQERLRAAGISLNDCRLTLRQPLAFLSLGHSLALVVAVKVVTTQRIRAYDLAIATLPLLFPALARYRRHWAMKRWLRLGLQLIGLALFGLVLILGGPEAWQQVAAGHLEHILISLLFLGFASMMSAVRLQLIARSTTGRVLAPWPRFYHLNMTTRALRLIVPRTLSTLGGKSVGLGALGVSLRRAVWIVMLDNGFDLLVLGTLTGPALLYLRNRGAARELLALVDHRRRASAAACKVAGVGSQAGIHPPSGS